MCGGGRTRCDDYVRMLADAGVEQLQTIFWGAGACAVVAAVAALVCFRGARTRGLRLPVAERL